MLVEPPGGLGDLQLPDEVVQGGEVVGVPGLACRDRQGDRDMYLADSGGPQEGEVGSGVDVNSKVARPLILRGSRSDWNA